MPKYVRGLPGFDNKVLSLFAKGMSVRNILDTVEELYGIEVSPDLISTVTEAVMDEFKSWQTRPLESTYAIAYLEAIHVKVRDAGSIANREIYLGIGIA